MISDQTLSSAATHCASLVSVTEPLTGDARSAHPPRFEEKEGGTGKGAAIGIQPRNLLESQKPPRCALEYSEYCRRIYLGGCPGWGGSRESIGGAGSPPKNDGQRTNKDGAWHILLPGIVFLPEPVPTKSLIKKGDAAEDFAGVGSPAIHFFFLCSIGGGGISKRWVSPANFETIETNKQPLPYPGCESQTPVNPGKSGNRNQLTGGLGKWGRGVFNQYSRRHHVLAIH